MTVSLGQNINIEAIRSKFIFFLLSAPRSDSDPYLLHFLCKMNVRFISRISWTSLVNGFLGLAFVQRAANCWSVSFVRNLELILKMRKWWGTDPSIDFDRVLSIQELMNSTPRFFYNQHGFLQPLIHHVAGIMNVFALALHFEVSGTVYEEQCPITQDQVFLPESRTTEVPWRIIPSICEVHSLYEYMIEYGLEDGASIFYRRLENHLSEGPLTIRFPVYDSYFITQGNLYSLTDDEFRFEAPGGHYILASALGTLDGVPALECQDSQGPAWGSSGYIYVALSMVNIFVVIR